MKKCGASLGRRQLLAGLGTAAATGAAGCVTELWASSTRNAPEQVSVTVKSLPADQDAAGIEIARQYAERLQSIGIDASIEPKAESELLTDVLLDRNFDIFVTRHPGVRHPDELYSLLHSVFVQEQGWQNPFGITNVTLDEDLSRQRSADGRTREMAIADALRTAVSVQPFSVIGYPEFLGAADGDLVRKWRVPTLQRSLDYLRLGPDVEGASRDRIRVATRNGAVTANRNPLAVEQHHNDRVLGLIYDRLARLIDGEPAPWLAESWRWVGSEGDETPTAVVTLREDLSWHDDEPLTATDVAFTYRFLSDTSMGNANDTVPAPRYRDASTLISRVSAVSDRECRVEFNECSREVAATAFAVPLFPQHIWSEQTNLIQEYLTRALVWENREAVGSGPLAFDNASQGQGLTLTRNDDHFLLDGRDLESPVAEFQGSPAYETLEFTVVPSGAAAIELIEDGEQDVVGSSLDANDAPRANRSDSVRLLIGDPQEFYIIGFNTRSAPLSNPRFRRVLGRLVDREAVAEDIFDGYASPANAPLVGTDYVPDDLQWSGTSAVGEFPGEGGEVDVDEAKQLFRDAGYRFSGQGELLIQNQN
ncbi:ABC transporter substrate-binding protein [Halostella litorea]|uniref:ABC transporter substrate-binding protein n=1 Tax=Halostella litorea TaxID=2528831 RepID=UPI0010921FE6|nr:ABC transporter substrate-binding protein [Halostella litorea]